MIAVSRPGEGVAQTASEGFARLLGFDGDRVDGAPAGTLIGLEHEYVVRDGDRSVDFRQLVREIDLGGQRLDPGDVNAHRCPWGGVVTADGAEAEIATPPVDVRPGFVGHLEAEAGRAAAELAVSLPAHLRLEGYSTHLSVAMPDDVSPRVCERIASTFAPGLMLLADRADSPGLLIRPRPGRVEAAFEFATGMALHASTTYFTGAVLASALGDSLLPALRVDAVATADRVGWGLRGTAYGGDLLGQAREAILVTADGGSIRAQEHLEAAWAVAREAILDRASDADLLAADRLVAGIEPLPVERDPSGGLDPPSLAPSSLPRSAFGAILEPCARPTFSVNAHMATWDLTVFHVASGRRSAFAAVPRGALPSFLDQLGRGELDSVLSCYLAAPPVGRQLDGWRHARRPGLFDSMATPASFIAPEAAYVSMTGGPVPSPIGQTTAPFDRHGKPGGGVPLEPVAGDEPPPGRPRRPVVALVVLVVGILLGGGIALRLLGDSGTPPPTGAPGASGTTPPSTPTSLPPVVPGRYVPAFVVVPTATMTELDVLAVPSSATTDAATISTLPILQGAYQSSGLVLDERSGLVHRGVDPTREASWPPGVSGILNWGLDYLQRAEGAATLKQAFADNARGQGYREIVVSLQGVSGLSAFERMSPEVGTTTQIWYWANDNVFLAIAATGKFEPGSLQPDQRKLFDSLRGVLQRVPASNPAAPLTKEAAGQAYLAAVGPVNSAEPAFAADLASWSSSTPPAAALERARPLLEALNGVEAQLPTIAANYPGAAREIEAALAAAEVVKAELSRLAFLNTLGVDSTSRRYLADRDRLIAASNAARAALGLAGVRS